MYSSPSLFVFMKKIIVSVIWIGIVVWIWFFSVTSRADLLDTAFQPSKNLDQVINIGNTKNAVGNEIFRWSTSIDISLTSKPQIIKKDSLLVRITKTLLRITIALAIPMIIFSGVKVIMSAMNGWEYKDELKNVAMITAGLILALSAIAIINLVQSLALQSLSWAALSL